MREVLQGSRAPRWLHSNCLSMTASVNLHVGWSCPDAEQAAGELRRLPPRVGEPSAGRRCASALTPRRRWASCSAWACSRPTRMRQARRPGTACWATAPRSTAWPCTGTRCCCAAWAPSSALSSDPGAQRELRGLQSRRCGPERGRYVCVDYSVQHSCVMSKAPVKVLLVCICAEW